MFQIQGNNSKGWRLASDMAQTVIYDSDTLEEARKEFARLLPDANKSCFRILDLDTLTVYHIDGKEQEYYPHVCSIYCAAGCDLVPKIPKPWKPDAPEPPTIASNAQRIAELEKRMFEIYARTARIDLDLLKFRP